MTPSERVVAALGELGPDEREVLAIVAERLAMGQRAFGLLDVNDGRDWKREALEEAADLSVYLAAELLRTRRNSG